LEHPDTLKTMTWFRLPPEDLMTLLNQVGMSADDLPKESILLDSLISN